MGKPDIPAPLPPPAARPERKVDVDPEDVQLGGMDMLDRDPNSVGKRALVRPRGNSLAGAIASKSGLSV